MGLCFMRTLKSKTSLNYLSYVYLYFGNNRKLKLQPNTKKHMSFIIKKHPIIF
jgi:hypothetical protein